MKRLVPVVSIFIFIAAFLSPVADCASETATITLYHGDNWISPPLVPFDPSPTSVFRGCNIDGNLTRFDPTTQKTITYTSANEAEFAGVLLGDGYKINYEGLTPLVITYTGIADGVPDEHGVMTEMWISMSGDYSDSLNAGGSHWIGQPFNHNSDIESMFVTDGYNLLTMRQAVSSGWIDALFYGFDAQTQTLFSVGLSDYGAKQSIFKAGQMYEVTTHVDNLALIIPPTLAVPEPESIVVVLSGLGSLCLFRKRS